MWKKKKVCLFFLLENSRPLSPWGPLDSLSICLGTDSLSIRNNANVDYCKINNLSKWCHGGSRSLKSFLLKSSVSSGKSLKS